MSIAIPCAHSMESGSFTEFMVFTKSPDGLGRIGAGQGILEPLMFSNEH